MLIAMSHSGIPSLLGTRDAAVALGVSEPQLRRALVSGQVGGERVAGHWVMTEEQLDLAQIRIGRGTIRPTNRRTAEGRMRALSFFSGAMGLDQGLELAGIQTVLACEIDRASRATIAINRPDIPVLGDIQDHDAASVRAAAGMSPYESIDVVAGGPPCQAFSTAGARRGFDDARGNVFLKFLELSTALSPKFIVIENVRGLLSMPAPNAGSAGSKYDHRRGAIELVWDYLSDRGYDVSFNLYNAANFGVPQSRERVVVIAAKGVRVPYLQPTHSNLSEYGLPRWRTLADAIGAMDRVEHDHDEFPARRLKYFRMLKSGQYWKDLPLELQREAMGKSFELGGGRTGFYRRLAWDKPSPTLVTHPAMPATDLCHPDELRPLSVQEYAKLQQFDNGWKLSGNRSERYRQLGNAVPVGLGEAIGRALLNVSDASRSDTALNGFRYSRYRQTSDEELFQRVS
jgi:DNA (cytosine-5)-methyltransferase 1